ncbi:Putative legume-like lectin, concanavalin A-like lectin/glucanase domain superfamily [Septoria linicola]|uniref:Legume-like lectin, concanavalin A-like lectin/glucanase domain superfamily n=1 Tax=Septoria linicola TaxID=215465 RepID=A0A9Q9EJY7_9PEZI|nr:putative legume-like lectin, concanavalin A-like lectin/glucanase domain superfamily [Septoria linicola]USW51858.1 Putative legume-like lectin, concanavalin A-like lectin/glucanase domain superfamily [Septoria linicola]
MAIHTFSQVASVLLAAWTGLTMALNPDDPSDIKSIPLRTHSLQTPYLDSDMQSRWWDFGGSTVIRADQYIRLTANQPSQAGWIYSRVPLTASNWEIELDFMIHGTGSLFGDGMAMWITKERAEMGTVFAMKDRFEGLGIFFDTYKNNRPGVVFPYVMAMLGDGQTSYDQQNDGKANELAGCSARGLRNPDFPTRAKITYFQDKSLRVDLMYKKEGEWTKCFEVEGVKLPTVTYLGFSSETGELSDNHDIMKVETKNLYSPTGQVKSSAGSKDSSRSKKSKSSSQGPRSTESGGWGWFFVKFLIFGVVVAGGYIGFTVYRAKQRDRF